MNPKQLLLSLMVLPLILTGPAEATNTPAPAATTARTHTPLAVIPSQWGKLGDTTIEPAHASYLGGFKAISYSNKDHNSHHAHFIVWGKLVYVKPQNFGGKTFITELVALHIDCGKSTYSQFRDIKLDEKGNVVDDSTKVTKFKPIDMDSPNLGLLGPAESTARGAVPESCGIDTD